MNPLSVDATCAEAFEKRYRQRPDPWDFATSRYERARYGTMLGTLSRATYRCIYEPGCSVVVLTERLARIADRVIATDFAPSAAEQAKRRCTGLPNVQIEVADVRRFIPAERPDLIVFSEICYYFPVDEIRRLGSFLSEHLAAGGELLAAHWLGHSVDHVIHADEAHRALRETLPMLWMSGARYEGFRIDYWRKS
jgi:trans-aconitate methyltransferase